MLETADDDCAEPHGRTVLDENVETIRAWERHSLIRRSTAERVSDWISTGVAGGTSLVLHAFGFSLWIVLNLGWLPIKPFDPYPFQLLTLVVSLEAIFLALFVLGTQNRFSRQSDRRSHVDLQIDLLAEREMTAVLQLLQDIARHLGMPTRHSPEQLAELLKKTDLQDLTTRVDETEA